MGTYRKPDNETEYAYSYRDDAGVPLRRCPRCGRDLTAEGGINLVLSAGENFVAEVASRLDEDGRLEDEDGEVAAGFHSATECGGCRQMLHDMEGVVEEQIRT